MIFNTNNNYESANFQLQVRTNIFSYNFNLNKLNFRNDINSIGSLNYFNTSINSITIPSSIIKIDDFAFYNNLNINQYNDNIFYNLFSGMLVTVNILNGVRNIGEYAFKGNKISSINLPESLLKISDYSFYINKIEVVNIKQNIQYIGIYAFSRNQIKTINFSNQNENLKILNENVFSSNPIEFLEIPYYIENIYQNAFRYTRLKDLLNEGLKIIMHLQIYIIKMKTEIIL